LKLLDFVEMPRKSDSLYPFHMSTNRDYFTPDQKALIVAFIKEYSSAQTWNELKQYDLFS